MEEESRREEERRVRVRGRKKRNKRERQTDRQTDRQTENEKKVFPSNFRKKGVLLVYFRFQNKQEHSQKKENTIKNKTKQDERRRA
jgi:hypothetical protein